MEQGRYQPTSKAASVAYIMPRQPEHSLQASSAAGGDVGAALGPSASAGAAGHLLYRDRSNDPHLDPVALQVLQKGKKQGANSSTDALINSAAPTTTSLESFPVRLHYMLNEVEKDGFSDVVSFMPHGRSFRVHNQMAFQENIIGSWFRMSKLPSFQRQLNLYGFKRITTGIDKGAYYHEKFLRQRAGLAYHIERFKVKGKGPRKPAAPADEPNFYAMAPMPPNPPSTNSNHQMKTPQGVLYSEVEALSLMMDDPIAPFGACDSTGALLGGAPGSTGTVTMTMPDFKIPLSVQPTTAAITLTQAQMEYLLQPPAILQNQEG